MAALVVKKQSTALACFIMLLAVINTNAFSNDGRIAFATRPRPSTAASWLQHQRQVLPSTVTHQTTPRWNKSSQLSAATATAVASPTSIHELTTIAPAALVTPATPSHLFPPPSKDNAVDVRSLRQKVSRVARTIIRVMYLGALFLPLAIWYPFASKSPTRKQDWIQLFLRQSERSGAVVIKMCQWASSRPDLFGTDFCDVTKQLQDGTTPHAWSHTENTMEEAYGKEWRKKFDIDADKSSILGSGCIAQVYKGTRKVMNMEGEEVDETVAIKVVHPNIRKSIDCDLDILRSVSHTAERLPFGIGEKLKWNNLSGMVNEFANMLIPQLDLRNEAEHIDHFNHNFRNNQHVVFPQLIDGSHPDVLIESFCNGTPMEKFCAEEADNVALRSKLCEYAAHTMCTMIFEHNFVHADLHPGNIFVTPEKDKLIFLDCGMVNKYDDADHALLVDIIAAFIRMDGGRAAELMADDSNRRLGQSDDGSAVSTTLDQEKYIRDIEALSKTPRKTDFVMEKITTYADYIFNAAATHHVKMNPSFISMALAVKVQEGVALMLNPSCDLIKIANPIILKCEANRLSTGMGDRMRRYAEDALRDVKVKMDRFQTMASESMHLEDADSSHSLSP